MSTAPTALSTADRATLQLLASATLTTAERTALVATLSAPQ